MQGTGTGLPMPTHQHAASSLTYPAGTNVLAEHFGHAPAWHADALCAQVGGDEWFQEKGGSTADAKAICRRCPVTEDCLQFALDHDERFGVWGGLSEQERLRLTRAQGRQTRAQARRSDRDARIRDLTAAGFTPGQVADQLGIGVHIVWHTNRGTTSTGGAA